MNDYILNSDDSDNEDRFLMDIVLAMPKIRIYPKRPDLFKNYNEIEFRQRFRLSKQTVLFIAEKLDNKISPKTNRSHSISTINQLLIVLRFLATGSYQITVGNLFNCNKSTICRIIPRVLKQIALMAKSNNFIQMPKTQEELTQTKEDFFKISKFPGVIGVIDCMHVKIQSPGLDSCEQFRNKNGSFSINVQCVSDANLKILDIEARCGGSVQDQTIFDSSALKARLTKDHFSNGTLLGDENYASSNFIMTPIINPESEAEKKYQAAHIKTRSIMEELFFLWKRRFPSLSVGFRSTIDTTLSAIVATAVLNNIARERNDDLEDFNDVDMNIIDSPLPIDTPIDFTKRSFLINTYFSNL